MKKFCSFRLLFAQMEFVSIIKMIKISNKIGNGQYVSTISLMGHSALGTGWYVPPTYQR